MRINLYTKRLFLLFVAVTFAGSIGGHASTLVFIDFEADEDFLIENAIKDYSGWTSIGEGGVITNEDRLAGEQSLRIDPAEPATEVRYHAAGPLQGGIRFIQIGLRPVAGAPEETGNSVNLWGSLMGFVSGRDGCIEIFPEGCDPEESIPTGAQVDLTGESDRWLHLTIRRDFDAGVWDLFVDGQLASINLPIGELEISNFFAVAGSETGRTLIDSITLTTENPLFADEDRDGLPDAYELAHKLNPKANDRNADWDNDGVSNIAEYLGGSPPNMSGALHVQPIIYVDNLTGSDANSGSIPYPLRGNGPKASIKAAMATAPNGAVIIVLPGTGIYEEGSRNAHGKRLTIRPIKPIIIK